MAKILATDDQRAILDAITMALKSEHEVTTVESGEECLKALDTSNYDCVLLDVKMPGIGGMKTLEKIVTTYPVTPVVMLTAANDIRVAVKAMKTGAFDYLSKPANLEELRLTVNRAIEKISLEKEVSRLRAEMGKIYGLPNVVGQHPLMKAVYERVEMVAPRKSTVLIKGESGTGKELIARAIQQRSPLRDGPFVPVNCAAIPDSLVEDEFFGHEKGAFTDARLERAGCFEQANGGTLFLDEISELSPGSQAKLLRVLQEREFKRVGGTKPVEVDVRLIAATNKNLAAMVEDGTFRQDLYYRVHVVPIEIPTLQKRLSDIPVLLGHFLKKIAAREDIDTKEVTQEAMDRLMNHQWPGNVRELENVAEQLMALVPGPQVTIEHLPNTIKGERKPLWLTQDKVLNGEMTLPEAVMRFELDTIHRALEANKGNKTKASKLLGLTRRVFSYKLHSFEEQLEPSKNVENDLPKDSD